MKYRYVGTEHLVYPYAAIDGRKAPLVAEPGMKPVELDEPPDHRWEPDEPETVPAEPEPQPAEEEKPRRTRRTTAAEAARSDR